jgi:hypothetical protein
MWSPGSLILINASQFSRSTKRAMNARAKKFLKLWCSRHINAVAFPQNQSQGETLAEQCLADARRQGLSAKEIKGAADGDLTRHMFEALYRDAEAKLDEQLARSNLDRRGMTPESFIVFRKIRSDKRA